MRATRFDRDQPAVLADVLCFASSVEGGLPCAPPGVGQSVESTGERYEQWTYYHGKGRLSGMADARVQILQIKFDPRGVLRAYNWSGEARQP